MSEILVERDGAVGSIVLNRPEALNAFTPTMLAELIDAVRTLERDQGVGAIVLSGAGRAFSAGVDLNALKGATPVAGRISNSYDDAAHAAAKVVRMAALPVIAQTHGFCFTGALELALHCDFILTTDDTKFGDTHAKWGLRPTWGMSQTLARAVGVRKARELSFSARTFTGKEAVTWGLANASFPDAEALATATASLARDIAAQSRGAVAAYKKLYRLHEELRPLEEALAAEVRMDFPEIVDTAARLGAFGKK